MRKIVFSDLDGTLLERDTYSHAPAAPAIQILRERGIPLVLCSSKTRAEMEYWRERMDNRDPFIVENGGAIYIPRGYFPFHPGGATQRGAYDIIELGVPYEELVATLQTASADSGCAVTGFHEMSVADICLRTSLSVRHAELAKQREYDEPFEIDGAGSYELLASIERRGKRWTRGDRLYHITGKHDKALAVQRLVFLFTQAFGTVCTIGVGNGHNDADFLGSTDEPIIVRSQFTAALVKRLPHATVTTRPGPAGWNEAILGTVSETHSEPVFIH